MKKGWVLMGIGVVLVAALVGYWVAGRGGWHGSGGRTETQAVQTVVETRAVQTGVETGVQTRAETGPSGREPRVASMAAVIGSDGLAAVSLHVKGAGLEEVVEELNKQMSVPVMARRVALVQGGVGSSGSYIYTLDVTNRTFWEVVGLLDDQCLINVHERQGVISLDENARSAGGHAVSGPFFLQVFERPITQSRPPSLGMQYVFLADSRVKVASISYSIAANTTRGGRAIARSNTFSPLNSVSKTGEATGASASNLMQHGWETNIAGVVTTITASATYRLESGEERKADFRLEVGQPEH